jgi:TPR repeat protein
MLAIGNIKLYRTEADSKISSRRIALRSVREELLGEIGTYIYSEIEIKQDSSSELWSQHEVKALTAGFVKVETLEEQWDGYKFTIKARLYADVDKVRKDVEALKSSEQNRRQQREQLLELHEQDEKLIKEVMTLRQQLTNIESKPKDYVKDKIAQYELAQNNLSIQEILEEMLREYGAGNYTLAFSLAQRAARTGDAIAQNNLGFMFSQGQGVPQDYDKALKWFYKAAEQGSPAAEYNIGKLYGEGLGVHQNYSEAVKWYRKAAEQGNAGAQYNLGVMYQKGAGVSRNYTEARRWYRLAAEQGYSYAIKALENLQEIR